MKKSLRMLGVAVATASMLALAACSSDGSTTDPSGETGGPAAELSAEAQAAADIVAANTGPVDDFTAPGPAVDGAALSGKTVFVIPAAQQIPLLNSVSQTVSAVLTDIGANAQICDAKLNPADAGSCIAQAIDAGAAVVITAGIPHEFAPAAFDSLVAAGIPWVQGVTTPAGPGDPTEIGYMTADNVVLQSWATNWIIADSDAKANALVIKLTDSEATTAWADFGILATYENGCSDCTIEVVEVNSGQLDRLPSLLSSALVANPDIEYVQAQFDQFLPAVTQGIQSAARDDIKVVSVDGLLSTLQDIAAGGNVKAAVGYNQDAMSWYLVDQAVRMAAGEPAIENVEFPFRRIFTAENVGELTLTTEAQTSGEWFGTADYAAGFLELWGVN